MPDWWQHCRAVSVEVTSDEGVTEGVSMGKCSSSLEVEHSHLLSFSEVTYTALMVQEAESVKGRPSPKQRASCAESNPSFPKHRRPTWLLFTGREHTTVEIAELAGVARSAVYRAIKRAGDAT